jgi:hypothetical protein
MRPLRGARIVSDHDNRFVEFLVERLQQIEGLFCAASVEITGGLIGHQDSGIGDESASDCDALLLTT